MKRRELLRGLSVLPLAGGILGTVAPFESKASPPGKKRDLFKELGVRTFINAAGTYTFMTGSLMHEEVMDAIHSSWQDFCLLDELQDKVGEKIALLTKAESAVVTSGCFSAMTLGLAGVLTGTDPKKAE